MEFCIGRAGGGDGYVTETELWIGYNSDNEI